MPAVAHGDGLKVPAGQADGPGMKIGHYTIVSLTNHWQLRHGAWYRDGWATDAAGCLVPVTILDELL